MSIETTLDREQAVVAAVPTQLLIGGRWVDAEGGGRFAVEDPSTGATLAEVADASPADAMRALDAAVEAQGSWRRVAPLERAAILRRAYELMVERRDDLALVMTLEMGKSLREAAGEVDYAAGFFRWFAEEATRIDGGYATSVAGGARVLTMRTPVGPSLLITPWNFPLAMGTRKLGPALAAGCTAIVKPAGQTPLSMLALGRILVEAGVPEGVVSIVTTSNSGAAMAPVFADPRLRKVSFTGSTEVGVRLLEQAARNVLRTSMELGGNAPFLVFEDADLDRAVDGAVTAKMRNIGEACTAANRFLVHESVADAFAERFAARLRALTIGRGSEPGVDVGPLIDAAAQARMSALVDDAVGRGATVLAGGAQPQGPGCFFQPTVLAGVPDDADAVRGEIFGPVAPIAAFADEEEALARANATTMGLIGYVFTEDLRRALRVSEALETGMVGLNRGVVSDPAAPFGGVKHSGLGREGGREGILEFLETKYVSIDEPGRVA